MFPFWLILGVVIFLLGLFNRQMLQLLGLKPPSEVMTVPSFKHSSRMIEQIGRWLAIVLGISFVVHGLGRTLPNELSDEISFWLLWLVGLMILAIIAITITKWKAN